MPSDSVPGGRARSFTAPPPRQGGRRRRLRKVLLALVGLILLLAVLAALAPMLAGGVVRGYVEDAVNREIPGSIQVGGLSLSWSGPQAAGPIVLLDPLGRPAATVEVKVSAGLWGLLRGRYDLGTVTLGGRTDILVDDSGETNIQRSLVRKGKRPAGNSAPSGPMMLPDTLAAKLVIDRMEVTFSDPKLRMPGGELGGTILMKDLAGEAEFATGVPLTGSLSGTGLIGPRPADATAPAGSFAARWSVSGLTDAQGRLTPGSAAIDASAELKDLSVAFADVLADAGGRMEAVAGPAVTISLAAKGTGSDLAVDVKGGSAAIAADLGIRYTPSAIEAMRAGTITAETRGLAAAAPGIFTAAPEPGGGTLAVDEWPRVEVSLETARVPLTGGRPDWGEASASLKVTASDAAARLASRGDDGASRIVAVKFRPLKAALESTRIADGVRLTAANAVEVDGHRAGDLSVDLKASNLVSADGAAPASIDISRAVFDGVAALSGFDTRAAQPFVQKSGVRLPQDVGPEVDLELTASGRIDPGSSLPETSIEVHLTAANMTGAAEIELENGRASTTGGGVLIETKNSGPLATRLAQAAGVRVQGGMPVSILLTDAHAEVQRLLRKSAGPGKAPSDRAAAGGPDLRGAAGKLTIGIGPATGTAPLMPGGPARPFRVGATTIAIDSTNIAQGVNLRTRLAGDIDGKPAGTVDVTVAVLGLLDEAGALRGSPAGPFRGTIAARGVPTALVQSLAPSLSGARVDLPADIGPNVDFSITAKPGEPGAAAMLTNLEFSLKSERLAGGGSAVIDGATVKGGATPLSLALQSPGALLARWMPEGIEAGPGGAVTLNVPEFAMPIGSGADPAAATGRANLKLSGVTVIPRGAAPVQVATASVSMQSAGSGPLKVGMDGSMKQGDQPFALKGDVTIAGLTAAGPGGRRLTPASLRPTGTVSFNDVPASILALAPGMSEPVAGGKPGDGTDLISLVRGLAGPKFSIGITMADVAGGQGTDARITVGSAGAHLNMQARVTPKGLALRESAGDVLISAEGIAALMDRFAPGPGARPLLKAPAKMAFTFSGTTVPRDADGMPKWAAASPLAWTASIPGRLEIDNLGEMAGVGEGDGPKGFGDLAMSGTVPLAALAAGGAGDVKASLTAAVLGGPPGSAQKLEGEFAAHVESGAPSGPMSAGLRVQGLDTRWADAAAGRAGLVSGLLGAAADVDAKFDARFAPASDAGGPARLHDGAMTAGIASPTFSMSAPAVVVIGPDRYELSKPVMVKATVAPGWADEFLLADSTAAEGPPEPNWATFTAPTDVTVSVSQLVIAQGEGPLKPGVFSARAAVDAPKVSMILGDGPAEFVGLRIDVSGGEKPGVIGFSMRMAEAGTEGAAAGAGGAGAPAPGAVRFAGGLYGISDDVGRLTTDSALITATGQAPGFKTAVLDAMAGRDGMLVDLLGPRVSLDVGLGGFGRESGRISVSAVSPRASCSIKGMLSDGVLVASEPAQAELKEVTKELGARLSAGLPLIGTFEKRPEDGPALLKATGLRVPFNHDMTQFNGDLWFDFGTARFQTSGAFSSILSVVGANNAGEVGRKLTPLTIMVRNGVISYDRYTLPLGEFTVQTQGMVDLVNRRIDFVTFIPLGALSDEAAGVFNTGLGRLLGGLVPRIERATMVPWRTSGPMDSPTTTPEVGLFLQNAGQSLFSPETDLFQRLGNLFGGGK